MCNRVSKKHENFTRNSSILARKQWYLRDANELFRKRDVSRRRYRVQSRIESRFHSRIAIQQA